MAQLIRCPHCNKFIDKNSKICPKCSQPLIDNKTMQEPPIVQNAAPKHESVQKIKESEFVGKDIESNGAVYKPYDLEPQPEIDQLDDIEVDKPKETTCLEHKIEHELEENETPEEQISTDKEMEAFYASMRQDKTDKKKNEKVSDDGSSGKRISEFVENFASNIVNNSKSIIGKGKDVNEEAFEEPENNPLITSFTRDRTKNTNNVPQKKTYNANADGYYDYVTAEIDARTEHVTTEMVIKTVSFIAIVIVIVVGMINFI